jgi:hypothetical protein
MKNNTLLLVTFLVALVATVILPVGPAAACTALTLSGVLAIFLADYGRSVGPLASIA